MTKVRSPLKTILNPLFAMTAAGLLLAGCNTASKPEDAMMQSSSSSADAMVLESSSSSSVSGTTAAAHVYKDGTYSAEGAYRSPAGAETVHVTLTLKDDIVTDAVFKGDGTAPTTVKMQSNFAAGYKEYVVGKSLDELSVSVVNGSSLTSGGFMDAVAKIKAEAKA